MCPTLLKPRHETLIEINPECRQLAMPKAAQSRSREHAKSSTAVKAAEDWIDDLQRRLGWHDRDRTYHALLATLHPLRDSLMRDEAIYVGAQPPPLLRALLYEGWYPGSRGGARTRAAFLERIRDGVHRDPGIGAEEVTRAVFAMLAARLPEASSKAPRPRRQNPCTTYGQVEATLGPWALLHDRTRFVRRGCSYAATS